MQAHAVEGARRHEAEPAAQFVADRDRDEQFLAVGLDRFRCCKCRRDGRRARMHDGLVVRVVEVHRMGERTVDEGGDRGGTGHAFAEDCRFAAAAECVTGFAHRSTDGERNRGQGDPQRVEQPQPAIGNELGRHVRIAQTGRPFGKLGSERHRRLTIFIRMCSPARIGG